MLRVPRVFGLPRTSGIIASLRQRIRLQPSAVPTRAELRHFTPSRNLPHVLDLGAVLPTQQLKQEVRAVFNPTDLQRLDGYEDHVCCSVQYPNGWYFARIRAEESVFRDWVVLLVDPEFLWMDGTQFCYGNAAAQGGDLVAPGYSTYNGMFGDRVIGAYGNTYKRGRNHVKSCPTDNQAEVLVPNGIPWERVHGVAFRSDTQAQRDLARLNLLGYSIGDRQAVVAPDMYNKRRLSTAISMGDPIEETSWEAPA